ncbi:MAG: hypothetical protein ACFFCO_12425 [Promethearchaeota archaeon]
MSEPEEYRDVITVKPVPVKIFKDRKTRQLIFNPKYWTMLIVLRQRPMTVRDLVKAYREAAEKDSGIDPKSDKTIYRYLKVLEEAGLIVPAGQRLVIGKAVTEKLFSRTADFFLLIEDPPSYWETQKGKTIAKRIGSLLSYVFEGKELPQKALLEILTHFDRAREEGLERIVESGNQRTLEMISTGSLISLRKIVLYVGIFAALLEKPELLKELQQLVG